MRGPAAGAESEPLGCDSGRGRACGGGGRPGQRPGEGAGGGRQADGSAPLCSPGHLGQAAGRPVGVGELCKSLAGGPWRSASGAGWGISSPPSSEPPALAPSSLLSVKSGELALGMVPGEASCRHPRPPCWTCLVATSFRGSI